MKEEMREALERERKTALEVLRGERVAFARKIKALTEEVDNVKRRFLAKERNPMVRAGVRWMGEGEMQLRGTIVGGIWLSRGRRQPHKYCINSTIGNNPDSFVW